MSQQLSDKTIAKLLENRAIEDLSYPMMVALFQDEQDILDYIPQGLAQIDPRTEDRILYNPSRTKRPHQTDEDRGEMRGATDMQPASSGHETPCIICAGKTTGVLDLAELSRGTTFINKNLYPILFPQNVPSLLPPLDPEAPLPGPQGLPSHGLHFLQWTSSYHDDDWHNMPLGDRVICLQRLAQLERQLLKTSKGVMPPVQPWTGRPDGNGFVSIIKNFGRRVGGSIDHGHQQIAFNNIMPRRVAWNWRFEKEHKECFAAYIQRENPSQLTVREYGTATLLIPYFMRRPYEMLLLLKDTTKRYLYDLNSGELADVADGWHDAIRLIRAIMPELDREIAFNVITHNGAGAGLYFEFLPYTQETGGFEHIGLTISEEIPTAAAESARTILAKAI
jgi:galactose-1-phosphate uridylyltransferase